MSARIVLLCNWEVPYGTCAAQIMAQGRTVEEARTWAALRGWRSASGERDYCPEHFWSRR